MSASPQRRTASFELTAGAGSRQRGSAAARPEPAAPAPPAAGFRRRKVSPQQGRAGAGDMSHSSLGGGARDILERVRPDSFTQRLLPSSVSSGDGVPEEASGRGGGPVPALRGRYGHLHSRADEGAGGYRSDGSSGSGCHRSSDDDYDSGSGRDSPRHPGPFGWGGIWASSSGGPRARLAALRRYLTQLLGAVAVLVALAALGIGLCYADGLPKRLDWSTVRFTYRSQLDHLTPYHPAFGPPARHPGEYPIFLDGHSHTTLSDGALTPEQLVDWLIASGFNAAIVTDHNTVDGGLRARAAAEARAAAAAAAATAAGKPVPPPELIVFPGMEYTCCRIHMNFININETVPLCADGAATCPCPTDAQLAVAIARTHALGGLAIVNHIPWSNTTERLLPDGGYLPRLPNHPSLEALLAIGIDGFEIANGETLDLPTLQWADARRLRTITGTDVHEPGPAYAWTLLRVDAQQVTAKAIWAELVAGRTSFLFDPIGTRPNREAYPAGPSVAWQALAPLLGIGHYFNMFYLLDKGMYSFQGSFCHPQKLTVYLPAGGAFVAYFVATVAAVGGLATLGARAAAAWRRGAADAGGRGGAGGLDVRWREPE